MSYIVLGLLLCAILKTGHFQEKQVSTSGSRQIRYCLIFGGRCKQKCNVVSEQEFAQFHFLCGENLKCCRNRPESKHDGSLNKHSTQNGALAQTSPGAPSFTSLSASSNHLSSPFFPHSYRNHSQSTLDVGRSSPPPSTSRQVLPFPKENTKTDTSFIYKSQNTKHKGCGVPVLGRARRIVGGTKAERCLFPWMVYISRDPGKDDVCGGTLVSERHVITAAHCYDYLGSNWPTLFIGEYDREDNSSHSRFSTSSYTLTIHPSYSRETFSKDIAILTLHTPVPMEKYECLRPICLPTEDQVLQVGYSCTVAGWGSTSRTSNKPALSSPSLMKTDIQILDDTSCRSKFGILFNGRSQLCAGDLTGRTDSCVGDSGGPLMCSFPYKKDTTSKIPVQFLMGVISSGATPCAQVGTPALYTDIRDLREWIQSIINL